MTVRMPPEVAAEILAQVGDSKTKTAVQLDEIAADYGMNLKELAQFIDLHERTAAVAVTTPVAAPAEPTNLPSLATRPAAIGVRVCNTCRTTKPLDEFRRDATCKDGHRPKCRNCEHRRPLDVRRTVNNRARHRATAALIAAHHDEFERLFAAEREAALLEHQELAAKAAEQGHPDAATARLKPGRKRTGQTAAIDRLDVARCPKCHRYHDAGHQVVDCENPVGEASAS